MRSITKKRGNNNVLIMIIAIVVVVILAVITFFSLARAGIININGITPEEVAPKNLISVAYIDVAVPAGSEVETIVKYRDFDLDSDSTFLPDDIIVAEDNVEGYVLRNDLYANTLLSWSLVCPIDTDDKFNATTRNVDISYISLQSSLEVGDYIDVRLKVNSTAGNFVLSDDIVITKKEVIGMSGNTITLRLNEEEQLLLTAAAVDMVIANSDKKDVNEPTASLYTTTYVSYAQPAAEITYSNNEMVAILRTNPNLINNPTALYERLLQMGINIDEHDLSEDIFAVYDDTIISGTDAIMLANNPYGMTGENITVTVITEGGASMTYSDKQGTYSDSDIDTPYHIDSEASFHSELTYDGGMVVGITLTLQEQ